MPTRLSEGPIVRRPICQIARLSEGPNVRKVVCRLLENTLAKIFRMFIIPKVHYSKSSLYWWWVIFRTTGQGVDFRNNSQRADFRMSENSFVRARLSEGPIVRKYVGKNIPNVHYSESSLFRKFIIPMLGHFSDHCSGGRFRNNSQRADFRTNAAVDYWTVGLTDILNSLLSDATEYWTFGILYIQDI